jgi:hypothetical protein
VAHAAATAAPVADARYVAFVRSARAQGYRPVTAGGKANWCREATSIDSRVTRQSCIRPPAVADAQGPGDEGSEPARTGE